MRVNRTGRKLARYVKPGEAEAIGGSESDLSLIARAQRVGRDGKPTADAVAARNTLILRHEAFIWMKVRAGVRSGVSFARADDLAEQCFAEGVAAFVRSIMAFDADRGFTLLTFAGISIMRAAWDAKNDDTPVTRAAWRGMSRSGKEGLLEKWEAAGRAARMYKRSNGEAFDPANITRHARRESHVPALLARMEGESELHAVRGWLSRLDAREAEVLMLRYFENWTLREVGTRFGLTRERVRQLQDRAIERLQEMAMADGHLVGKGEYTPISVRRPVGRR